MDPPTLTEPRVKVNTIASTVMVLLYSRIISSLRIILVFCLRQVGRMFFALLGRDILVRLLDEIESVREGKIKCAWK